jgi:hypothetical protein
MPHLALPRVSTLRQLRRGGLALSLLLGACGGGGGGDNGDATSSGVSTSAVAFPFGMSWAPATALVATTDVPTGALGVSDLNLGSALSPAQAQASAQADAVAHGRVGLSASGWLHPEALFDTTLDDHASCWRPQVSYASHDDSTGSSGTLVGDELALWADHEGSDPSAPPCATAEVQTRLASLGGQAHQAMLLLSALRQELARNGGVGLPGPGQRSDLTARGASLFQGLLGDASVVAASVSVSDEGSELSYRLRLTRGSGTSAQVLEMALLHTPADTDTRYAGTLQLALSYLSGDNTLGCSDQRDAAGRYKLARLLTLGYNRQDEWMSLRARSGLYCGNGSTMSADQINDLASLTLSGELDPAIYLSGSTRGPVAGWRRHFLRWGSDHLVSAQSSDFLLAWQAQPHAGAGHARLLAGHASVDTSAGSRSVLLASGHTDDISITDGTLKGLICNVNGPGAQGTIHAAFQMQQAHLGRSDTGWILSQSHHRIAPTNSCQASATMRFDLNGDGSLGATEGAGTTADLVTPSQADLDAQDELNLRGFLPPVLLL